MHSRRDRDMHAESMLCTCAAAVVVPRPLGVLPPLHHLPHTLLTSDHRSLQSTAGAWSGCRPRCCYSWLRENFLCMHDKTSAATALGGEVCRQQDVRMPPGSHPLCKETLLVSTHADTPHNDFMMSYWELLGISGSAGGCCAHGNASLGVNGLESAGTTQSRTVASLEHYKQVCSPGMCLWRATARATSWDQMLEVTP